VSRPGTCLQRADHCLLTASRSLACSLQAGCWPACSEQVNGLLASCSEKVGHWAALCEPVLGLLAVSRLSYTFKIRCMHTPKCDAAQRTAWLQCSLRPGDPQDTPTRHYFGRVSGYLEQFCPISRTWTHTRHPPARPCHNHHEKTMIT
jgi:hypothetical protein